MTLTRRIFLNAVAAALLVLRPRGAKAVPDTGFLSAREFDALSAFVDTLIPADDHSPAGSALNVPRAVVDALEENRSARRIVASGCRWLDQVATTSGAQRFSSLDEQRRVALAEAAAEPNAKPLPKAFFAIVRDVSMRAYYARAASWGGLGYDGPPQPNGFVDYRDAPSAAEK